MNCTVSARTLAEFYYERGDLYCEDASLSRMLEGVKGHKALQDDYKGEMQSEVPLAIDAEARGIVFHVQGRADGLLETPEKLLIEEIKTTASDPALIGEDDHPEHWAQAEIYAFILSARNARPVEIRLTYYALTGSRMSFERTADPETLKERFYRYLDAYAAFFLLAETVAGRAREALSAAAFPYAEMRPGQRKMMAQVYHALKSGRKLMIEAPTGIGKTIGTLFPALKAIGEGLIDRVFYLTARGTQKATCEEALARLRANGAFFRSVTITAKDKICPCPDAHCDPALCSRARGYFDRRRDALTEALSRDEGAVSAQALADRYELCPFELSLDLSETAQVIICDYNYAFDPRVYLRRHFERKTAAALLIDEAHALPDRAREMLSAALDTRVISEVRREYAKLSGRKTPAYKALTELRKTILDEFENAEDAESALTPSGAVTASAEKLIECLTDIPRTAPGLNDLFFAAVSYVRTAASFDGAHSRQLSERHGKERTVTLYRFDPSAHLSSVFKKTRSAVLFSATLTPPGHFARFTGIEPDGEDAYLKLPGPFPRENLLIAAVPLDVRYRSREATLPAVCKAVFDMADAHTGNYLACFPSYAYMNAAYALFTECYPGIRTIRQDPGADEEAREAFLDAFCEDPDETLIGFCVLGGLFTEGIDLAGSRLTGAAVVSVGQPTRSLKSDTLSAAMDGGYDEAYTYPGMTKVVQAAGRVIRSETDRGAVLLIDRRYTETKYRQLLPAHMQPVKLKTEDIKTALSEFLRG